MKIEVTQENLNKALVAVSRIASARGQLPILADVLLKTDNEQLTISATDLEVAITAKITAKIDQAGQVAVPARLLADFVNNLPHVPVVLENDGVKTKISAGGFTSVINGGNPDEFPALPEVVEAKELTVASDVLREAIIAVAPVASADTARPILTGVYFYTTSDKLMMVATDGYRLAEKNMSSSKISIEALVPASTVLEVSRLISDDTTDIAIKINNEQISFILGDVNLTSRLIDGKFIDYQQLIPTKADFSVVVDRAEFIRVVRVASIFAHSAAGSIILKASTEQQNISVATLASELGENNSSIDAEVSGDGDGNISLNSKYLLDALNFITSNNVKLRFSGKLAPVLLMGENDDYKHIIMPVKS